MEYWRLGGTERLIQTIEVAPEKAPCVFDPTKNCLQVRRPGTGGWEYFSGEIDGFIFEPGFSYIIRVERTSIADARSAALRGPVCIYWTKRSGFVSSAARLSESESGSVRNWSTFLRMRVMPGLGQSVPHNSLCSSSASLGK